MSSDPVAALQAGAAEDEATARNTPGGGAPPIAQEAATVAEADWYEANGIEPDPGTQAWAHKLAQDMFTAGVEWAAYDGAGVTNT